ncbi:MAG: hypothetical protein KAI47_27010, partial [Deltaproteobacteria bacterium]|nr:hypothetical protein [Deltaproteobacteria bacterium]
GVRLQDGAVATFNRATIEANRGVGLFVRRAESVTLLASKIAKTRPLIARSSRLRARQRFGDGVQLVIPSSDASSPPRLVFQGVDLRANARAACLFHGPSGLSPRRPFSINNVSLSGGLAHMALSGGWGLVVQGGMTASNAWGFTMAPSLAEVSPPAATLEVATNLAIPGLAGLQNPLIGETDGLIRTDGTVYIQIGGKGLDPGRGP